MKIKLSDWYQFLLIASLFLFWTPVLSAQKSTIKSLEDIVLTYNIKRETKEGPNGLYTIYEEQLVHIEPIVYGEQGKTIKANEYCAILLKLYNRKEGILRLVHQDSSRQYYSIDGQPILETSQSLSGKKDSTINYILNVSLEVNPSGCQSKEVIFGKDIRIKAKDRMKVNVKNPKGDERDALNRICRVYFISKDNQ